MWRGNPTLTSVLFGLPLGFLSLIMYSMFCSDILDANDDEENEGKFYSFEANQFNIVIKLNSKLSHLFFFLFASFII